MSVCIATNQHNNFSHCLPTDKQLVRIDSNIFSIQGMKAQWMLWSSRSHQRKQLARLDDRLLADVGISPEQVKIETAKPFWKP